MSRPDDETVTEREPFPSDRVKAVSEWLFARPALLSILCGLGLVHAWFIDLTAAVMGVVQIFTLAALLRLAARRPRYRYGFLFALAYFLPITHWLGVFVGRWTASPLLFGLAWGFVALGLALPLGLIVPLSGRLLLTRRWILIPFVWLLLELFRSYVPVLAFPWGLLAHPYAGGNGSLKSVWLFGGEFGFGFLLVLVAVIFARKSEAGGHAPDPLSTSSETTKPDPRKFEVVAVGSVVFALFAAAFLSPPRRPDLTLAAYQPGLDLAYGPYAEGGPARSLAISDRIRDARERQARTGADLLVLPEGLISSSSPADLPQLKGPGTLLLGGQRKAGSSSYQTAFAYDGKEDAWESADKTRLVIFGEFVPGRGIIPYPPSFSLPGGDLSASSELRMIDAHGQDGRPFRVGPILCFEALFPDIAFRQKRKGADVLAVMSLDDWFGGTKAPEWLEMASRWRAAENGLPLIRVGSLGHTSLIDGRGRVKKSLEWGESGVIAWNPARD